MRASGGDFEGIGELIVTDHVPATDTYHVPAYDGNGIVTGLVQSSGTPTASRFDCRSMSRVAFVVMISGLAAASRYRVWQVFFPQLFC